MLVDHKIGQSRLTVKPFLRLASFQNRYFIICFGVRLIGSLRNMAFDLVVLDWRV